MWPTRSRRSSRSRAATRPKGAGRDLLRRRDRPEGDAARAALRRPARAGASLEAPDNVVPPGVTSAEETSSGSRRWDLTADRRRRRAALARLQGEGGATAAPSSTRSTRAPGGRKARADRRDRRRRRQAGELTALSDARDAREARRQSGRRFTILRGPSQKRRWSRSAPSRRAPRRSEGSSASTSSRRDDSPADPRLDRRRHGVGGPSAGLAFALEVLQQLGRQRRPWEQDRGDRRDLPERLRRADRGDRAENDRRARSGCGCLPRPGRQNATDARKYAHGLRIIPVKSFQQALRALATLPEKHARNDVEISGRRKRRKLRVFSPGKPLLDGEQDRRRIASRSGGWRSRSLERPP
jgi:hypothetical protein